MDPIGDQGPQPTALEQFADWLARRGRTDEVPFAQLLEAHPLLAAELHDLHATWLRLAEAGDLSRQQEPSMPAAGPAPSVDAPAGRAVRVHPPGRYTFEGEVARGGMGAILRVWDEDLRRHLAMNVALASDGSSTATATLRSDAARLMRFLEEARVTSQLDHPGIVPVHELGLDAEGRHFFTMKLVEGRDMRQVFELVFAGEDGWNQTRALGVILKVCEAMAYAHRKGIIHRDLKPANVMVGSFGEVFVMDWGLSRVMHREDLHDLRLVDGPEPRPDPQDRAGAASPPVAGSHLMTMDGVVLGTPAYMPPEQARGDIEQLSPRSDVYSIGAMLYHLLARQVPYSAPATPSQPMAVLARVRAGPPPPLHQCNPAVPAELVAICERAMARDPVQRYPDTLAFAEDLRAYLEHRVVAAYETGAIAELRKWIVRNRALATACAAAFVILVAAVVISASLFVVAKEEAARADDKAQEAEGQRRLAAQRAEDVLSLSAGRDLQELVARAATLWPPTPANIPGYEAWLRDAHALLAGRAADPERGIRAKRGLADHRQKLAELAARAQPPDMQFASSDDSWWFAQLTELIAHLEAFADPATGLCSKGTSPEHGWGVEQRLEMARTIDARSITGPDAAARWQEAIASIADPASCPLYQGLRLAPQPGLLPLGRSAASGLWEFAHLPSGEPAGRAADGAVVMHEGAGLVFVLIPGGTFWMGAQKQDPTGHNYDPLAGSNEAPVHQVELDAYFLSKFEMTQDQWVRLTGKNPSAYGRGANFAGKVTTGLHPVEQVSWRLATEVLQRMDLLLPTEAQWERAARGTTTTSWWTGPERQSLQGAANLADGYAKSHRAPSNWKFETWLDDGYPVHAPVGQYRANAFGLHDVAGNVFETCREGFGKYDLPHRTGDGERQGTDQGSHMIRGGAYHTPANAARAAFRFDVAPHYFDFSMGLRPLRSVTR